MKKNLIIKLILGASILANLSYAEDNFTGDKKLACEAILCLSSGSRPSECNPSIKRYFGINAKKWKDTLKNRKSFLSLCPSTDFVSNNQSGDDEKEYSKLIDILVNLKDDCSIEKLNSELEYKTLKSTYQDSYDDWGRKTIDWVRPVSILSESCKQLMSSNYTYINPVFICDKNSWFKSSDWKKGFETVSSTDCISGKTYKSNKTKYIKEGYYYTSGYIKKGYYYISGEITLGYHIDDNAKFCKREEKAINTNCWVLKN